MLDVQYTPYIARRLIVEEHGIYINFTIWQCTISDFYTNILLLLTHLQIQYLVFDLIRTNEMYIVKICAVIELIIL